MPLEYFIDIFPSLYHTNTYLPPVPFSKDVSKYLLENEDKAKAEQAQKIISDVQSILSEPWDNIDNNAVKRNNQILTGRGFRLLGIKSSRGETTPFYSAIEHDNLPGWVIKPGIGCAPEYHDCHCFLDANSKPRLQFKYKDTWECWTSEDDCILRIEMASRISKVARDFNLDVVVPKKKLVPFANINGIVEENRKYCVVCEKINVLSKEETIQAIGTMDDNHQRAIARTIHTIVKNAGFANASSDSIRLTPEGKLAFIDTKPQGLLAIQKPNWLNTAPCCASIEKCARFGSEAFNHYFSRNNLPWQPQLQPFFQELTDINYASPGPKLSEWKIALSCLSAGLLPIIFVIISLVRAILLDRIDEKIKTAISEFDSEYDRQARTFSDYDELANKSEEERLKFFNKLNRKVVNQRFFWEHQAKLRLLTKQYSMYTEGIYCCMKPSSLI